MQALLNHYEVQVMYMEPGHERRQAERGRLLTEAITRLDYEWCA